MAAIYFKPQYAGSSTLINYYQSRLQLFPAHPSKLHLLQSYSCIDELVHDGVREGGVSQQEGREDLVILQNIFDFQPTA